MKAASREPEPCRVSGNVFAAALLCTVVGCSTHADRLRYVRQVYSAGDLKAANTAIARLLEKPRNDSDVLKLNQSVVELFSARPRQAERLLRQVRDQCDLLESSSAAEAALSIATDDGRRAWAGEDYEKVLIRVFLALSSLMTDGSDAEAYALQIQDLQERIERRESNRAQPPRVVPQFKRVAVGPWLRAALLEESHANYDDIARSRIRVVDWEAGFRDGQADLQRARAGRHSQPGSGVVYIIALVGRGPWKVETEEVPTQAALLIADRILSESSRQTLPPTIAPVRVAKVVTSDVGPSRIRVLIDGNIAGTTATITDVGRLALAHYEAIYPRIIARAVVRRVLKKGAVYAARQRADAHRNPLVDLTLTAAGVAWEATENADTRCWGLLPDRIQVLRLEMPAGHHQLDLQPVQPTGRYGPREQTLIDVADGRNTYVLASFPEDRLAGRVLTSRTP